MLTNLSEALQRQSEAVPTAEPESQVFALARCIYKDHLVSTQAQTNEINITSAAQQFFRGNTLQKHRYILDQPVSVFDESVSVF